MRGRVFAACLGLALTGNAGAGADDATVPGTPVAPHPTLNHLTLEWPVTGDSDLDGVVSVRFRVQGTADWRPALPLRRVPAGTNEGHSWTNRHSGSLFGLLPATTYEVELTLADPDGGNAQQVLVVTTRAVPTAGNGAVRPATPANLATVLSAAQPGDIVTLGSGTYAGFTINTSGNAGAPITLRGTAGALVQGEIGLFNRQHLRLEGLLVHGRIRFNGSNDISIVGNTIVAQAAQNGDGIVSFLRAERAYIAGNTVTGQTVWQESSFGASGNNLGEGILVNGPGHVITGNTVRGFRDGISFMEDAAAVDQSSIDVLDNVIGEAGDDGIEADFCAHNCRIVGNRLVNTFIAMSAQPSLGGPTWFVRNQAYNVVHLPFKLYRGSIGDVLLHNTIVKQGDGLNAYPGRPIARAYARNNLFLGGAAGTYNGFSSGSGRVVDLQTLDTTNSSFDYNGYGSVLGTFTGRLGATSFASLAQLRTLTSEAHAEQVALDSFAGPPAFPADPLLVHTLPDLAIRADGPAADRGVVLPNINDGFSGIAPDLGAIESTPVAGEPPLFASGFEGT